MDQGRSSQAEWFVSAFGELYPLLYAHRDDESATLEVAGLVKILDIGEKKSKILDVCCGAGRHAAALAAMGFEVMAFDLSPNLLEQAAAREELKGCLARADIRALPFASVFDVVINLFTSFGYFATEQENRSALSEMARVLVPGGCLVLDHMNRSFVEQGLVREDTKRVHGFTIIQQRRIEGDRIMKEIHVQGKAGEEVHLTENVRLYAPEEIEALLGEQGLGEVRFYGAFNGEAFHEASERMIVVGTKEKG